MSHDENAAKHPEINSTANKPSKGPDEANVVIQLVCKVPKKHRERYEHPAFTAGDCLRQDVGMYESGEIGLSELIESLQMSYVDKVIVQVTR